jgi:hypothetical chaperone protein
MGVRRSMTTLPLGFDFGTTNSAMSIVGHDGRPRTTPTFRSVLYFDPDERGPDRKPLAVAGPVAIERYLEGDGSGRLIQSLKSYLASRSFRATGVFGTNYTLEELIALVVRGLRKLAEKELGELAPTVVVGRPVRFAGEEDDQDYALDRLRTAIVAGGFQEVIFEAEPVAAAYHYESTLDHDELVLIADFGGGTSDFCLVRVGPGVRARGRRPDDILGTEGVGLAGDAFDAKLIRRLVAPELGRGSEFVSHGKKMPIPPWLYSHLERWHHLSFLKSRETMKLLDDVQEGALEPAKVESFRHLVDSDLGYQLYRAVEKSKVALSNALDTVFSFHDDPIAITAPVTRAQLDTWIAEELSAMAACVDRLLAKTNVAPSAVDRVFMTGGTSLSPAVREIFSTRFGLPKLRGGNELTSVSSGLALRARDLAEGR